MFTPCANCCNRLRGRDGSMVVYLQQDWLIVQLFRSEKLHDTIVARLQ